MLALKHEKILLFSCFSRRTLKFCKYSKHFILYTNNSNNDNTTYNKTANQKYKKKNTKKTKRKHAIFRCKQSVYLLVERKINFSLLHFFAKHLNTFIHSKHSSLLPIFVLKWFLAHFVTFCFVFGNISKIHRTKNSFVCTHFGWDLILCKMPTVRISIIIETQSNSGGSVSMYDWLELEASLFVVT